MPFAFVAGNIGQDPKESATQYRQRLQSDSSAGTEEGTEGGTQQPPTSATASRDAGRVRGSVAAGRQGRWSIGDIVEAKAENSGAAKGHEQCIIKEVLANDEYLVRFDDEKKDQTVRGADIQPLGAGLGSRRMRRGSVDSMVDGSRRVSGDSVAGVRLAAGDGTRRRSSDAERRPAKRAAPTDSAEHAAWCASLVGRKLLVPGSWWVAIPPHLKKNNYPCQIKSYEPERDGKSRR